MELPPEMLRCGKRASWRSMAGKALIDGSLRVSVGTTKQMKRFWKAFSLQEGLS